MYFEFQDVPLKHDRDTGMYLNHEKLLSFESLVSDHSGSYSCGKSKSFNLEVVEILKEPFFMDDTGNKLENVLKAKPDKRIELLCFISYFRLSPFKDLHLKPKWRVTGKETSEITTGPDTVEKSHGLVQITSKLSFLVQKNNPDTTVYYEIMTETQQILISVSIKIELSKGKEPLSSILVSSSPSPFLTDSSTLTTSTPNRFQPKSPKSSKLSSSQSHLITSIALILAGVTIVGLGIFLTFLYANKRNRDESIVDLPEFYTGDKSQALHPRLDHEIVQIDENGVVTLERPKMKPVITDDLHEHRAHPSY